MERDVVSRPTAESTPHDPSDPAEPNGRSSPGNQAEHGVVYTRPWVVEFILDLAGYDPRENLVDAVAVEPSCGTGEFLEPMIRRLSESCRQQGRHLQDCAGSLQAFELDPEAAEESRRRVVSALLDECCQVHAHNSLILP